MLPESRGKTDVPGKYADTAIPLLVQRLHALGRTEPKLLAKIAGGANMFATEAVETIGQQNVAAIESALDQFRIRICGRHCGGEQGRKMTLDVSTGDVTIEIVGSEIVSI